MPEKSAYVMERLGKFYDVLRPGIHVYMPFVFRIAYGPELPGAFALP